MRTSPLAAVAVTFLASAALAQSMPRVDPAVTRAIADPSRPAAERARDVYRHPAQTLAFFGVTPTKRVVEFLPSGGWYSSILARVPAQGGSYTALVSSPKAAENATRMLAQRGLTGTVATLDPATGTSDVPAGSQDVVLTFRNVHNWRFGGADQAQAMFAAMFAMLKPGGTLGVVEHRLPEGRDASAEEKSGYMKESSVIGFATKAGFKLAGRSEVNANPRDTADWPQGVWTLPPSYRLGDTDRAKYAAIGESDRMTLRFVKPR